MSYFFELLKVFKTSVPGCPRDDMDRFRVPDDVSQEVRPERGGSHVPGRRDPCASCVVGRGDIQHGEQLESSPVPRVVRSASSG